MSKNDHIRREHYPKEVSIYAIPGITSIKLSIVDLCDILARKLEITMAEVTSRTRKRDVLAKQQQMMFLMRWSGLTYVSIGAIFGKDHATVMHSCSVVKNEMKYDKSLREFVTGIQNSIFRNDYENKKVDLPTLHHTSHNTVDRAVAAQS